MTKPTNYQLPKWEKTDRIQMKDFNDMTATLDAALGTIPKLAVGTYVGDGAFGYEHLTILSFDFKPKIVLISAPTLNTCNMILFSSAGGNTYLAGGAQNALTAIWSGNQLSWYGNGSGLEQLNNAGTTYYYFAV